MKRELSKADVEDLIVGATLLGVGGGGNPENGLNSLMQLFDTGKKLMVWTLDEFSAEDQFASPYFVGSVAPPDPSKKKPVRTVEDPIRVAFRLLEADLGKKISATVASEIGGGNTAASIAIAAKLGIPTVDGDLMGRAGPELHQSTIHIFGIPMAPSGIASETGNEILIEKYASIDDYEAIARYSSVVSGGHVAVVDSPLTESDAEKCVVKGTMSKCIELGRIRKKALVDDMNPAEEVAKVLDHGKVIFEGEVHHYVWKDERGFLFGDAEIRGLGKYEGSSLRSWIMNEHIMCWINDKPAVMPPDLIMFLDPETGLGITNDKLRDGRQVAVVGSSIDSVWRKERGLELFGPRRFNLDYDYVPFEAIPSLH
jgi:uncharacterized protein